MRKLLFVVVLLLSVSVVVADNHYCFDSDADETQFRPVPEGPYSSGGLAWDYVDMSKYYAGTVHANYLSTGIATSEPTRPDKCLSEHDLIESVCGEDDEGNPALSLRNVDCPTLLSGGRECFMASPYCRFSSADCPAPFCSGDTLVTFTYPGTGIGCDWELISCPFGCSDAACDAVAVERGPGESAMPGDAPATGGFFTRMGSFLLRSVGQEITVPPPAAEEEVDSDGDLYPDDVELMMGTDPRDREDYPGAAEEDAPGLTGTLEEEESVIAPPAQEEDEPDVVAPSQKEEVLEARATEQSGLTLAEIIAAWEEMYASELSNRQLREAHAFFTLLQECKENLRYCRCDDIIYASFAQVCQEVIPVGIQCEEGNQDACAQIQAMDDPTDLLPDYLQHVTHSILFEDDVWRRLIGDLAVPDEDVDSDGDGLSDQAEGLLGSDPHDPNDPRSQEGDTLVEEDVATGQKGDVATEQSGDILVEEDAATGQDGSEQIDSDKENFFSKLGRFVNDALGGEQDTRVRDDQGTRRARDEVQTDVKDEDVAADDGSITGTPHEEDDKHVTDEDVAADDGVVDDQESAPGVDGDTVAVLEDLCPNTPEGAAADANGCAPGQNPSTPGPSTSSSGGSGGGGGGGGLRSCADQGGINCGSDACLGFATSTYDADVCCLSDGDGPAECSYSYYSPAASALVAVTYGPCFDPDRDGLGRRAVYEDGGEEMEDCTTLPNDVRVPFGSVFVGVLVLFGFYARRRYL